MFKLGDSSGTEKIQSQRAQIFGCSCLLSLRLFECAPYCTLLALKHRILRSMTLSCGQRQADSARRRSLGAPVERYENFRQKSVMRFNNERYSAKAKDHMVGRSEGMAKLLSCLSVMRNLKRIARPQPVLAAMGVLYGSTDYTADVLYILARYSDFNNDLPVGISDASLARFENDMWAAEGGAT